MDTYFSETANQNAPISFFAQLLKYLPQAWIFDEDKRLALEVMLVNLLFGINWFAYCFAIWPAATR